MNQNEQRFATLTVDGKSYDFPILQGTHGNDVIDIRTLGAKTGLFTYDSGFLSTASCSSTITFIDGEKGQLLYRGYPIDQLAEKCTFLEVAYLLINGDLPNQKEKEAFEELILSHTMVHDQLTRFYNGFRRDAHPMAIMVGVVGALSAFYHDAMDFSDSEHRLDSMHRLIAKLPTIVAMAYKYNVGEPFMYPRNDLGYTANFMHMMFGTPCGPYRPNPARAGHHFHAPCGSRAERLHLHGALGRFLGREPLRLRLGGHFLPVGAGAWRRQRSLPENAGRNRRCFPRGRIHQARQG